MAHTNVSCYIFASPGPSIGTTGLCAVDYTIGLCEPLARFSSSSANLFSDFLRAFAPPQKLSCRDAGVGHLLYYHIVPPLVVPGQKALWLNGAEDIFPDYTVGQDGVSFSLPANGDEIIMTRDGL